MENYNTFTGRGNPIDCSNDEQMVREANRVPLLKIDRNCFKKTTQEKLELKLLKAKHICLNSQVKL
jgi:hypothetical protein